jgi:hypothetical protein
MALYFSKVCLPKVSCKQTFDAICCVQGTVGGIADEASNSNAFLIQLVLFSLTLKSWIFDNALRGLGHSQTLPQQSPAAIRPWFVTVQWVREIVVLSDA